MPECITLLQPSLSPAFNNVARYQLWSERVFRKASCVSFNASMCWTNICFQNSLASVSKGFLLGWNISDSHVDYLFKSYLFKFRVQLHVNISVQLQKTPKQNQYFICYLSSTALTPAVLKVWQKYKQPRKQQVFADKNNLFIKMRQKENRCCQHWLTQKQCSTVLIQIL